MQPWIIDANDMDADDILKFQSNLLHPNQPIRSFLHPDNKGSMIIIGPKGFGKTLLLKAKRLSMQGQIGCLIPSGALVDKPSGSPSVAPTAEYGDLRDTESYWKTLWLLAFAVAVLRTTGWKPAKTSRALTQIFENPDLMSPCDIFDHILTTSVSQYHALRNDYNDVLLPRFRHLHEAVAVFVDNIDEYYESVLREIANGSTPHRAKRSYWHLAQHGIAAAARELNQINSHVKIYVSIRREVLQGIVGDTFFGQQLRGKSVIMAYNDDDLREIIAKNIAKTDPEDLAEPGAKDPIRAFFGDLSRVTHPGTGDEEDVIDFWLRHTLGRPRDVVAIGRVLAAIPPRSRSERRIREVVRGEAKTIARAYLAEMSPHLEGFDPDLLVWLLKKNVMTPEDLAEASEAYQAAYQGVHGEDGGAHVAHPFCALFKLGLVGYVARDPETNEDVQVFRLPGEESLEHVGVLPKAGIYLIHPALDDVIAERNPKYFETLNDRNVVGRGRPWLRERAVQYVLKGDVAGYSAIMRDAVKNKAFLAMLDGTLEEFAGGLDVKQRDGGDSIVLIDPNPSRLIQAALNIQRDVRRSEFGAEIRFGGDAGFVDVTMDRGQRNIFGMAIQNAARVEPHAPPGRIMVTAEFRRRATERFGAMLPFGLVKLGPEDLPKLDHRDGSFNIGKASDGAILTALHLVDQS